MKTLIFATANGHKLTELRAILPHLEVLGLPDIGIDYDIPETGLTLEENAYIKAKYLYDQTGKVALSEDTGLEVFALAGQLGVHTARYAGDQKNPQDNMNKLLDALRHLSDRSAQFRTVIALVNDDETLYFEGIVKGRISTFISDKEGFGYDPVFIPDGYNEPFSELNSEIKNQISHRARAVSRLMTYLNSVSDQEI